MALSLSSHLRKAARKSAGTVTDFILPPLCGICQQPVASAQALCIACWHKLTFIHAPLCGCCGAPFSLPTEEGLLCALCLSEPPAYSKARAALVYDETARQLISRFKYGDQLHLLPVFAPWLQRAGADLLTGVDAVVPVPLHWTRLWWRRFNQATLLAKTLGLPVDHRLLVRSRRTTRQVGLSREERLKNVRNCFAVRGIAQGKTLLLVDDVYTTGATLDACTRALLTAGAKDVRVLTLARVIRPQQIDG